MLSRGLKVEAEGKEILKKNEFGAKDFLPWSTRRGNRAEGEALVKIGGTYQKASVYKHKTKKKK